MVTEARLKGRRAADASFRAVENADGWTPIFASDPILNFIRIRSRQEDELASDYPEGSFDRVVENLKKQPSLLVAIEAWNIEEKPEPTGRRFAWHSCCRGEADGKAISVSPIRELLRKETKNDDGTN